MPPHVPTQNQDNGYNVQKDWEDFDKQNCQGHILCLRRSKRNLGQIGAISVTQPTFILSDKNLATKDNVLIDPTHNKSLIEVENNEFPAV